MDEISAEHRRQVLQEMVIESELVDKISGTRRPWWWNTPCDELGGSSPRMALAEGRFEEVLELVRGYP